MLLFILVAVGAAIVVGGFVIALQQAFRRPTAREQAAASLRRAAAQVDDVFYNARVRMEEAAGRRRPGERRIGDGLRSSWRDW